jgi:putative acetyltransferase
MSSGLSIRKYKSIDAEAATQVYKRSVAEIGPEKYSPEQVEAWASYPEDIEEFNERLESGYTLVAEAEGSVVTFGSMSSAGHLSYIYTLKQYARRGIAASIYMELEKYAAQKGAMQILTEASLISAPFFETQGFKAIVKETVMRKGVELERVRTKKTLLGT